MQALTDNFSKNMGIEFDSPIGWAYFLLWIMAATVGTNFLIWGIDYLYSYLFRHPLMSAETLYHASDHDGEFNGEELIDPVAIEGQIEFGVQADLSCIGEFSKGMSWPFIWLFVVVTDRSGIRHPENLLLKRLLLNSEPCIAEPFPTLCGRYASKLYFVCMLVAMVLVGIYSFYKDNKPHSPLDHNITSFRC